jgi:hypothetical protein
VTLALSADQADACKLLTLIILLCVVGACNDETRVLDSTGSKQIVYCDSEWVKCIHDACPAGFDIVVLPKGPAAGIVKCH